MLAGQHTEQQRLAQKIEDLIKAAGGRNIAAQAMQVSPTTVDNYRLGNTQPKFLEMLRLTQAAEGSLSGLLEGSAFSTLLPVAKPGDDTVLVPRYDIRASAGGGGLVISGDVSEYYSVPRGWLLRALPSWAPPNARVGILQGAGDSMEPTIFDGDLVMVVQDVDERIVDLGGIFVFGLDGRLLIKRLQVLNNGDLRIISDNRSYEPETIPQSDLEHRVEIYGYVFFAGGRPRSVR